MHFVSANVCTQARRKEDMPKKHHDRSTDTMSLLELLAEGIISEEESGLFSA